MSMTGLLLINLGTPDAPDTPAVRRYLRQFLSDPRVLDMNAVGRWLLLNLIILPFRPGKSAAAYRIIWTERGSPLLFHGQDLARQVAARLGPAWRVELAMRYGQPSIAGVIERLRKEGVDRIVVLPLFPQYASSSTGSALEVVYGEAGQAWNVPWLNVIEPFYDDDGFIVAFAERGRQILRDFQPDHHLFSFHGLPERQVRKSDESGTHCLSSPVCCERITQVNRNCYRAQCVATARRIAADLGIDQDAYSVCFQSRLGRIPWIQPYTDKVIDQLARAGKKRLLVFSPAFVADCLETVEEIGIRAREQFLAAGGEELLLVPSLNSEPTWVDAVVAMVQRRVQAGREAEIQRLSAGSA
jgi:protoporphyrin/coproporphyrin ferrochelatase